MLQSHGYTIRLTSEPLHDRHGGPCVVKVLHIRREILIFTGARAEDQAAALGEVVEVLNRRAAARRLGAWVPLVGDVA